MKSFKIKGVRKRGRKEEFLKYFHWGEIAGDETSNRTQNVRMNLKMSS